MKKLAVLTLTAALLSLLAIPAMAGDASGSWKSKMETPRGTQERTFVLKQDGDKLTGKIVTPRGETEIKDGKITGDDIEFKAEQRRQDASITVTYKGKITGDSITGTMNMGERTVDWTATREK